MSTKKSLLEVEKVPPSARLEVVEVKRLRGARLILRNHPQEP